MLHTELSFSIYDKFDEGTDQNEDIKENLERTVTIGESIEAEFSFGSNTNCAMGMIEEDNSEDEQQEGGGKGERIEDFKVVMNGEVKEIEFEQSNSGDLGKVHEEMVCANPSNPLLLKNYAQLLESKGEFAGAEEYYYRATLADSTNGEILYRYAKLVWELHRDQERALTYFEKAALAAPDDSHILSAYASFLWEIDEDEEEGNLFNTQVCENGVLGDVKVEDCEGEKTPTSPPLHLTMGLGSFQSILSSVDYKKPELSEGTSVKEYYRRMLEENSGNPLFLKNYDQFLLQSKGYLQGAEEYYLRAIVEDPSSGQIMSQYANLLWQLHRDKDRADEYFSKAIQATPEDSHLLASYAKFLWETEDEEEDSAVEAANNQSKGDVLGAEEYYLRALLENPSNGGIMSQYATLLWQLHGDKDRADEYFNRAIQATPGDSDVLASYAKFLWEIEDEEEDSI